MGSLTHRLTCFVIAFALSGSSTVLAACTALCATGSMVTHATATPAHHQGHEIAPAPASPHAHHGAAAPGPVTAQGAIASPDAHLASTCDSCCDGGSATVALGPGMERTDGKAFAVAHISPPAQFHLSAATGAAVPTIPDVPPPWPARARLALRI